MAFSFDPRTTAAPQYGSKSGPREHDDGEEEDEAVPPLKKKKKATQGMPASLRGLSRATEPPRSEEPI